MADELNSADETPTPPPSGPASDPTAGRRRRRPLWPRRHPVALVITLALVLVALGTSTAATVVFNHLDGNLADGAYHQDNPDDYTPPKRHKFKNAPHQPLNILVMGDDSRDCSGCQIDKEAGGGSDTTILIHLSRDRQHAYGVSIPRDTMVDRPACANPDGGADIPAATYQQWNAAYSIGGPSCTVVQFEQITGIAVDDSVVVNFQGFKDMVDAVGGVEVCIPEEIDDREHGIDLQPGTRTIDGNEALSYVRERHSVGDGSDLGRIKRQQAFIASMVHAVLSAKTLSAPFKVYSFLNAVTKNLEFSDNVSSVKSLAELAYGFRDIGLDKIKFFTAPIATDPQNPEARVILAPTSERLFSYLSKDTTLPQGLTTGAIKAGAVPGQTKKHPGKKTEEQDSEFEQAGLCTV